VEPFNPIASQHIDPKQLRAKHIIDGVKRTLGFTILRRGVWIGHLLDDPTRGKECTGGISVELTTVVTLDGFDGVAKLRRNKEFFLTMWEKCPI
jgi:hypothetical protein